MRSTRTGYVCAVLLAGCFVTAPTAQQGLAERYAGLMLDTPDLSDLEQVRCVVPSAPLDLPGFDLRRLDHDHPLPDGTPLRGKQVPRFIRPTQSAVFGFRNLLVLGDYETVTFERWDRWDDEAQDVRWATETWRRETTRSVAGRLASVFHPSWSVKQLRKRLRNSSWGVDDPVLYWGRLLDPETGTEHPLFLSMAPPDVPESPVVQINDHVQYASHVVNILDPDFGDSRVQGGDLDLKPEQVTRVFYDHFADRYETVALVSGSYLFGNWGGFHTVVRNDIEGIGLELFDRSGYYGSRGVLQAVEGYRGEGGWAALFLMLHEQGHQYGDKTAVWSELEPPIERYGHAPEGHTPLLFPGAVAYGSVLSGDVQVQKVGRRFEIQPTLPFVQYHPLTLYRMGLVPPADLPQMLVFRDQGQFHKTSNVSPASGTPVTGETVRVTANDLMAADGVRRGPVVEQIRRAVVYVSRGALATKAQMDVLNYFARRLGTSSGVTSWDRYPSFEEATNGLASMTTRIRPKHESPAAVGPDSVRCVQMGRRALVGVVLDEPIGGCLRAGQAVRVSGRLALRDRSDYDSVCMSFVRYPNTSDDDDVFECSALRGDRFDLEVVLSASGGYQVRVYAFWPGAPGQHALSSYTGAVEVR